MVTNGCFDLLHLGHVSYLAQAREKGDALIVGVNTDESVRKLKGEGRPIHGERDRALILAALQAVDVVCIFPDPTALAFLEAVQPDIYVKGGDYTLDTLNQEERQFVEKQGGRIVFIPFITGKSTTRILQEITQR